MMFKWKLEHFALLFFLLFFLIIFIYSISLIHNQQQFVYLADSFLQGKLYFLEKPGEEWADTILHEGRSYWHLGPLPAVALMPFVFLGKTQGIFFYQGYLQLLIVPAIFVLVFLIARKSKFNNLDSTYWTIAFCLGSTFLGVGLWQWSWFFSQTIAVLLGFICIYESITKKRQWLIGICLGLLLLTRITASLIVIYFVLLTLSSGKKILTNLTQLLLPFCLCGLIFMGYNWARYGDPLEQGLANKQQGLAAFNVKAREYGLFSSTHIATNLYYSLLSMPLPVFKDNLSHVLKFPYIKNNPRGISIFVTTPYLFYLFFFNYSDRRSKIILFSSFIVMIPTLLFFATGYRQFGYRYALDILPLVHFLLISKWAETKRKLDNKFKILVACSCIFNLVLFLTIFTNF